jgi:predicted DNA-binding transcriptional regulator
MRKAGSSRNKNIEKTVHDILKTRARSLIYIYLLGKNGVKSEQIIKGTKLHPSTVRETLSAMYNQKLILREKLKNDSIGKNPYIYYPISPIELLKRHANEMEENLNKLANLAFSTNETKNYKPVKINIKEKTEQI